MIANRVKALAEERQWSVAELQRQSGLEYSICYRIFMNRSVRFDLATLDALCRAFGVGVGELLEYSALPVPLCTTATFE
jgi:DNA-binding Xre family transcriptional regulator